MPRLRLLGRTLPSRSTSTLGIRARLSASGSPEPKKIILYISQAKVTTTTRCLKGTTVSKLSRSFHTDGTRNMLWLIAGRQDVCHVSVAAALKGGGTGYVSVNVYPR